MSLCFIKSENDIKQTQVDVLVRVQASKHTVILSFRDDWEACPV